MLETDFKPVTPQQFLDLMNRLTQHSREIREANAHDASYVQGWSAATNTAIVALWSALQGNHEVPACELPEQLRRVICKACRAVQFKSAAETTGCVECGCNTLAFFRRTTDVEVQDPYGNADHDKHVCDCEACENWRRAEATHVAEGV